MARYVERFVQSPVDHSLSTRPEAHAEMSGVKTIEGDPIVRDARFAIAATPRHQAMERAGSLAAIEMVDLLRRLD